MNYSSKLLEKAVEEFAKLPGIGKKTALRLVLNLLNREVDDVTRFATAITSLREEIRFCKKCHCNVGERTFALFWPSTFGHKACF